MSRIRLDDLVTYKGITGIVMSISEKGICTISDVNGRSNIFKFPIESLELVARKGTGRYSMLVEEALPVPVKRPAKHKDEYKISTLQSAYANAKVSKMDSSDNIDVDLSVDEILERVDLALDLGDEEMFNFYSNLYKNKKS